eukprot:TRINITY_DN819_c0_g2_i2.p1 TRINITY_DN819_c0_g2~~TRINITY_DN819_c0_g2_i2.p1  ORF type:complete len:346 (+),score=88.22 TRINITY_DN819_c0_g2_i2:802-1839(+)
MKEGVAKNLNADELVIKTNERVRWTEELHEIFVAAALKLGPKAVPSKVLAEMKCTVLTRDQVASHLQNYRPILFGKEEDSKPKKQETKTAPTATKRVDKRKKSSEPVTKEGVKAASASAVPKKKQRANAPVTAQQPKAVPVVSNPKPVVHPIVTVKPVVVAAPVAPVVEQSSVAKEEISAPIPEPKKDFFLSMSSETNDRIIDQFFGDLDLLGTEFNHDGGIDNLYSDAPVGDQLPSSSSSYIPSLAGRLDFDIIEEDREEYASPLSECGYVCSPPAIQSPPAETSIFTFDSWGSSEIQLEFGEVEIETDGGLTTTELQQLDSSKVEQDHSCWYCDAYTGITSFI